MIPYPWTTSDRLEFQARQRRARSIHSVCLYVVLINGSFCSLLILLYLFPLIVQLMSVCVLLLFLGPDFIVASRLPYFCVHVVARVFSGSVRVYVAFQLCFLRFHRALFKRSCYVLCPFKCYVCFVRLPYSRKLGPRPLPHV